MKTIHIVSASSQLVGMPAPDPDLYPFLGLGLLAAGLVCWMLRTRD